MDYQLITRNCIASVVLVACHCGSAWTSDSSDLDSENEEVQLLTPGLEVEIEHGTNTAKLSGNEEESERFGPDATVNWLLDYQPYSELMFHFDYEIEAEEGVHGRIEELYGLYEFGDWGIQFGRQDIPFGQSESEFIDGPIIEFAEVNATALLLRRDVPYNVQLSAYAFESEIDSRSDDDQLDWGLYALYENESGSFQAALGYLSDLSEARDPLVERTNNVFLPSVSAASIMLNAKIDDWSILFEHVRSLDSYIETESEFNEPKGSSLEIQYEVEDRWLLGLRYEVVDEAEDFPDTQYGLTFQYQLLDYASIGFEYLVGEFPSGTEYEDEELELDSIQSIKLVLTFEM